MGIVCTLRGILAFSTTTTSTTTTTAEGCKGDTKIVRSYVRRYFRNYVDRRSLFLPRRSLYAPLQRFDTLFFLFLLLLLPSLFLFPGSREAKNDNKIRTGIDRWKKDDYAFVISFLSLFRRLVSALTSTGFLRTVDRFWNDKTTPASPLCVVGELRNGNRRLKIYRD